MCFWTKLPGKDRIASIHLSFTAALCDFNFLRLSLDLFLRATTIDSGACSSRLWFASGFLPTQGKRI